MTETEDLSQRARFLRNAAPQAFLDFCAAFEKYKKKSLETLADTTIDLQLAQGHAQQCKKIMQILDGVKNG